MKSKFFNAAFSRRISGQGRTPYYRMEKRTGEKSADLYLYDVIGGGGWFDEGTSAKQFVTDLAALGDLDTINLFINSPGGSVFDGVAIYNALDRNKAKKIVNIDGMAASIASVVAMVGDEINIAKNGMMMIHNPMALAMGPAADLRAVADKLDKIKDTLVATYCDRSGAKMQQITDWMDAETWFNSDEACAAGLADSVSQQEAQLAAVARLDFLASFRNLPPGLRGLAQSAQSAMNVLPSSSIFNGATPYHDLPLAARDRAWDASAADKTVQKWASSDGSGDKDKMNWEKYSRSQFWEDPKNKEAFGGYKLGFAEVISGTLTAIPRGIFAVAGVLNGARGGVDIPDADKDAVKAQVEKYYEKMRTEFKDDSIVVPWKNFADMSARNSGRTHPAIVKASAHLAARQRAHRQV